jgi:hypothetical protein
MNGALNKMYRCRVNEGANNNIYPWVVVETDTGDAVAFAVTQHTAQAWAQQLNQDGYITAI